MNDFRHKRLENQLNEMSEVKMGIDLDDYYGSTEWDLLEVPAKKYAKYYTCCDEPYPDIKFNITIRRKTLFYTVNLILPCVAICSVTLLVFYIPANSGEKITMGITILNSLNIFLLLVAEINPPTSLATPLIGKYLLFTMVLVTCSIIVTVFVLNIHFRTPATHTMSPWIRELFLLVLPRLLFMRRPTTDKSPKVAVRTIDGVELRDSYGDDRHLGGREDNYLGHRFMRSRSLRGIGDDLMGPAPEMPGFRKRDNLPNNVLHAMIGVSFIADHLKQQDKYNRVGLNLFFITVNTTKGIRLQLKLSPFQMKLRNCKTEKQQKHFDVSD